MSSEKHPQTGFPQMGRRVQDMAQAPGRVQGDSKHYL